MSSKKFVYLLMTVALVCGFIMGDTAHGQSTGSLTFSGSVLDADDNPVPGYTISAEFVPARANFQIIPVSRPDGSYSLAILGFAIGGPTPKINVGEVIKITATHADGSTASATHTVTADDVASSKVEPFNIRLSGLTVQANPPSIPAHDSNTSTITVTVREGGAGVTGDTISLSVPAGQGTVDATATEVGDGVYTATYTAPSLALVAPESIEISVSSATTELKKSVSILLTPVPTTVSLELGKSSFIADTPETTTVTVKVDRIDPVTDETVTLTLNPAAPEGGSVSDVTNNGDGSYSATYTSGGTAGPVMLTATATKALATASETITINAGPPANIDVTADPTVVFSLESSTITAMVTDSNGNPAGGDLTAETTSGGTVGEFTSTVFGTYTAIYSAPALDVEQTEPIAETITVSSGDASGSVTIELRPEEPIDVTILTIEGTVYKEDGEIPADEGTEVTVTVGEDSKTTTTDANGYMILFIGDLIAPVATTGDMVSIAVADANVLSLNINGTDRVGSSFRLGNDILETVQADESVTVDVTTDIVIPPRSVTSLVVKGNVYKVDGETPADGGLDVMVTVGENSQTVQTETDGSYQALFIRDLITSVATTGDPISVVVSDSSGVQRGTNPPPPEEATLSNKELGTTGSGEAIRNVTTDIVIPPRSVTSLVVKGNVYKVDGETPADSGLDVMVTVGENSQTVQTETDGSYMALFISDLIAPVAITGDTVSVAVADANVVSLNVNGTAQAESSFDLTNSILEAVEAGEPVTVDVMTDIVIPPRSVSSLVVKGMVYKVDGSTSAGSGLDVMVTVGENSKTVQTETDGSYMALFISDLITTVATTGDPISVVVSDSSGERGRNLPAEATLSNTDLGTAGSGEAIRNVTTDIGLTTSFLAVGGTVYLKNGDTDMVAAAKHLRETELTVTVTNTTRNISRIGSVDNDGQYEVLFTDPNFADVAETDDEIVVEVQNDAGVAVGSNSHTLTDDDINATRADIDVDTTVPARVLTLHVEGDVIELDGSSAGPGVEVTLTILVNGIPNEAQVVTDAAGRYRHLFAAVSPGAPAARTDDILRVQVLRVATGYFGYREMELRTHEIAYENQPLIVMPPIKLLPPTLRLGGLSINTSHADEYYGYLSLEAIQKNPELLQLIPSGILHVDLSQNLLASLPSGFNPTPEPTADPTKMFDIDSENFGNGITPRPAWHVLAGGSPADSGRWLNGNQLSLYVVTGPIPSVQSVTFTLTGPQGGTMEADPVAADGHMHNFQLEEERAILFLPSWPSLNMNAPIFSGVNLVIDGQAAPIAMTSKLVGDEVVWEAPVYPDYAGSTVYYHYQVDACTAVSTGRRNCGVQLAHAGSTKPTGRKPRYR